MKKIQEKYKNDPQKSQQEVMKLYKENGVNPLGGCLPLLVQIPILIALFAVFNTLESMQGASFLWIKDLYNPDPVVYITNIICCYNILIIKVMQPAGDSAQSKQTSTMNTGMAIFMGFMSLKFKGCISIILGNK